MIHAITHPTDFSTEGIAAFAHALRLALARRCRLDVLHVRDPRDHDHWDRFPHVRDLLERWGVLAPGAAIDDITARTGVQVRKVEIRDAAAADGLSRFLASHRPDLIVMASHGRDGINRWLLGSVSAEVLRKTQVPTLVLGPAAMPFVDAATGALRLNRILVPVTRDPSPAGTVHLLSKLTECLGVTFDFMHVGADMPRLDDVRGAQIPVRRIDGPVVDGILAAALTADLIAMPTAGRHGILDALRGSTIERVVREAPCPVLAVPAMV